MSTFAWMAAGIGDFFNHLAPTLLGVLLGGYLVQKYWISRANEAALMDYFSKELSELVNETLEYWSLDYSTDSKKDAENRQQARRLEQKIKGSLNNLNRALQAYSKRYCSKTDFTPLVADLHQACTAGTFEAASRGSDPARYLAVVNAAHQVRWKLFERRI